jgi:hypothetical protein
MFGKDGKLHPEEWHFQTAAGNGIEITGRANPINES